jgi:hypothetical protein
MFRKTMPLMCLAVFAGLALALGGCKNNEATTQEGEHPKAEHPQGEHPSEHPQGEHPKRN